MREVSLEMQNFRRHVVDENAQTDIIRSLRKEQAALNFLLKVDRRIVIMKKRYLIVYKNCQARCMHPLGQSEFLDIDIHPIHIFKKGRTLSVTGESICTNFC